MLISYVDNSAERNSTSVCCTLVIESLVAKGDLSTYWLHKHFWLYINAVGCKSGLIFMPGMAFDQSNNRLGHGKGFYDKYISHIHSIVSSSQDSSMPKLSK